MILDIRVKVSLVGVVYVSLNSSFQRVLCFSHIPDFAFFAFQAVDQIRATARNCCFGLKGDFGTILFYDSSCVQPVAMWAIFTPTFVFG